MRARWEPNRNKSGTPVFDYVLVGNNPVLNRIVGVSEQIIVKELFISNLQVTKGDILKGGFFQNTIDKNRYYIFHKIDECQLLLTQFMIPVLNEHKNIHFKIKRMGSLESMDISSNTIKNFVRGSNEWEL